MNAPWYVKVVEGEEKISRRSSVDKFVEEILSKNIIPSNVVLHEDLSNVDVKILEFDRRTELIKSKSLDLSKLGWQKFDITHTVRKWYGEGDKRCLRLLVDCLGCGDRVDLHFFNNFDQSHSEFRNSQLNKNNKILNYILNVPTQISPTKIKLKSKSNIMKRVRRRAFDCSGAPAGQCCKQKFYVNFRELGWDDWIIAPHGYYVYCKGDCTGPRTPDVFQSYHSHVIEEYRKIDRLSGIQPCCAPVKLSSMSLIYYEEKKKIVKRDLPKMIGRRMWVSIKWTPLILRYV